MSKWPIGTFINMLTVTIGSLIGMGLQQVFPQNIQEILFQAIGLITILLGTQMSLKVPDGYLMLVIISLLIGSVLGELIHLDQVLNGLGDWIKESLSIGESRFTEGLIAAFLLFCIGSITFVGAIEEGISGKRELLLIKSTLDGISSIAFASTYGIGVLFSIFPMLLFQGGLTVLAGRLEKVITTELIDLLSAIGGLLIIALGLNLLEATQLRLENMLPALLVLPVLYFANKKFSFLSFK